MRSRKNDRDDLICKAEIETQTQRTNVWIPKAEAGVGGTERLGLTPYTADPTYKADNQ